MKTSIAETVKEALAGAGITTANEEDATSSSSGAALQGDAMTVYTCDGGFFFVLKGFSFQTM